MGPHRFGLRSPNHGSNTALHDLPSAQSYFPVPQSYTPSPSIHSSGPLHPQSSKPETPTFSNNPYRHRHRPAKQFRRLFARIVFRWTLTVLCIIATLGLFNRYKDKGVLTTTEKRLFNGAYTGLSLLMGFNIVAAFKSLAGIFRWRVLASMRYGGHTAEELDLILGMTSFQACLQLVWRWVRKPKYCVLLGGWVVLGFAVQVGIALVGLTINHEDAAGVSTGKVNVTDFAHFWQYPDEYPQYDVANSIAHSYGAASEFLPENTTVVRVETEGMEGRPEDIDQLVVNDLLGGRPEILQYLGDEGSGNYTYQFYEYVDDVAGRGISRKSRRTIDVSTACKFYPIIDTGEYSGYNLTVLIDGKNKTFWDVQSYFSIRGTVYVAPSLNMNASEIEYDQQNSLVRPNANFTHSTTCGPRCGITEVFHFTAVPEYPGHYYRCETTFSEVRNANLPVHHVPPLTAVRAASAIGTGDVVYPEVGGMSTVGAASYWTLWNPTPAIFPTGDAASVEKKISRFAIGAIAMADKQRVSSVEVLGDRPWEGTALKVYWRNAIVIFVAIAVVQLGLGVIVVCCAGRVLVREESVLVMARLCRDVLGELGERGSVSGAKELAGAFGERRWRYGVVRGKGGETMVGIVEGGPGVGEKLGVPPGQYYE